MSKNLCVDCKYFNPISSLCIVKGGKVSIEVSGCPIHYIKSPTLFEQITQSPETLAVELVTLDCDGWWAYDGIGKRKTYPTREEAITATIAKLKEVVE